MKYWQIIFCVFSISLLVACSRQEKINGGHLITIEQQKSSNTLFYSGIVQPLKTTVVPCPADGVIIDMPVQYGDKVKKGQLLYVISSVKFLNDYKSALTAYIKSKSQFNNSNVQLKEADFLHKNQLISDDDFKTKQSNFYGAQLELVQAKDNLESLMRQLSMKENVDKLTIADIDKISQIMHLDKEAENILVTAPIDGLILSATKSEEENNKKNSKGDAVKQGDMLAVIGNMQGLSVRIKVNELTINQLKVGQKVKVTGIAFPNDVLNGEIERLDRQGEISNGNLPTFNALVHVAELTEAQKKEIHVGMSAKVEIIIDDESQIMIPLKAIKERNGSALVKLFDSKNRTYRELAVKTGKTSLDSVAILSGLKVGDKIVVAD